MVYTRNGRSQTDSENVYYSKKTDSYDTPRDIVKEQWENNASKPCFEYAEEIEYYFQSDENNSSTRRLVSTEKVPYAISYLDLN